MIKLTVLHYKLKTEALERFHNINNHNESLMFNWEQDLDTSRNLNDDFPEKPFIEPFEFKPYDYIIIEKKFRVRLEDIYSYMENEDGVTELTVGDDITYTVKESIEEIDQLFGL